MIRLENVVAPFHDEALVTGVPNGIADLSVAAHPADVGCVDARGFPGMFTPQYCVSSLAKIEAAAASATCRVHASSASRDGSIESTSCASRYFRRSVSHSTCCSIETMTTERMPGLPAWAIMNKFRKSFHHETEISPRPIRPLLSQRLAVDPFDIDLQHRPRGAIETRGEDDHVEFVETVGGLYPRGRDLPDRSRGQVHKRDIRLVEHSVIVV